MSIQKTSIEGFDYMLRVDTVKTLGEWKQQYNALISTGGSLAVVGDWLLLLDADNRLLFDIRLPDASYAKYFGVMKTQAE